MGRRESIRLRDKEFTPEQRSAFLLQKVKRDAEAFLGEPVEKAVVAVPAYFYDNQRSATKDACRIAGLEAARLVNEPTVASLAYGLDRLGQDLRIAVLDLGGGALDVTIMQFGKGVFEVKATSGDTQLGVDPMECVAAGTAIQAAVLSGEVGEIVLVDVTPLTLGVETLGGVATPLIACNTPIPIKKTEIFTTAADMQTAVTVHVFQGERPMSADNTKLGEFNLEGLPPAPRGIPKIEVAFDFNSSGILKVTAKDLATSKSQSIRITGSTRMRRGSKMPFAS